MTRDPHPNSTDELLLCEKRSFAKERCTLPVCGEGWYCCMSSRVL